ncbi:hypothetical protein [Legionella brunensis]|uniref:Uncharacterized protein n=1 Tax=Legionella brunensis TaxID=29422 RepID=A0A0W0S3R5_9GAMM|nr:hypothetical protein [Legionella brunensis]KTC78083.1 hypothetical protein Lbru_2375 [Legionella brunensis]
MAGKLKANIRIFDFDLTISKGHTFSSYCLDRIARADFLEEDIYKLGKKLAVHNIKNGVPFEHDADHLSAIATYHNNPAFIAGYISHMLGKELKLAETLTSDEPATAINVYTVEGIDRPIFISYLPDMGNAFQAKMAMLQGKNNQINFLKKTLIAREQITETAIIDFYDDTDTNYVEAQNLEGVNCHFISRTNPNFTIIASQAARVLEKNEMIMDSDISELSGELSTEVEKVNEAIITGTTTITNANAISSNLTS